MSKKLLMIVDMEGIAGISIRGFWATIKGHPLYFLKRKILVDHINAAIEGAIMGGIKPEEIVIADWHATHHNFYKHEIVSGMTIIRSDENRILEQGIEKVFLIGFHARAGLNVPYAHSFTYPIEQLVINGKPVGETTLWAYNAGSLNIPIALLVADSFAINEAKELGLGTVCVETKNEHENHAPEIICEKIKVAAREAVSKHISALASHSPFAVRFSFKSKKLTRIGKETFLDGGNDLFLIESKNAHCAYDDFRHTVYAFIGTHVFLRKLFSTYKGRS